MPCRLFDSHCHLDFDSFQDDLEAILQNAKAAGVVKMTTIGSGRDTQSAEAAVALSREHPGWINASVGVHPHDASCVDQRVLSSMEALAQNAEVVAIGEVGLDYYYEHSPVETQKQVFRSFIDIAASVKKPLIIHTRDAAQDTLDILRYAKEQGVGGIIHCFSEDATFAKHALDLGFVISFSGIVTFKNADAIRDAARIVPDDSLLIETDAPFLAPIPKRGKRNEPAFVQHVAAKLAEVRQVALPDLCEQTFVNACRIFNLDPHAAQDNL